MEIYESRRIRFNRGITVEPSPDGPLHEGSCDFPLKSHMKGRMACTASMLAFCILMAPLAMGATAQTSLALTLRANILAQQSATALGKGVSASDPNIHVPGTEAYQKYQAAIETAKLVSSQIANQRDLAAVTVSYAAQSICSGVYVQNLPALVPPSIIQCQVPADCTLQVIPDAASVGIPPSNLSPGTVLMTLPGNCTCPFPLPTAQNKPTSGPYYARADSFSPQDQFSGIATPVLAWNPKYGCQVLQHVTTPIQQDPLYPTFTDDGQAPVVFDWPIATANSSAAFPNVNYSLIQSQMAQFFPNTAPPNVSQGIVDSNTYAIGVFYKGKLIAEQYAPGITNATKLNSNSIIKSFFINYMAALRSVDGKMSIDDLIGAPHWGAEVILERGIKLDNLLRTNAGLSPEGGTIPEAGYYSDTIMLLDQPDIPAYAAGLPLAYAPAGAVWDYSNAGFAMSTLAIRNSFGGDNATYWSYPFNKLYKRVGAPNVTLGVDSVGNLLQTATGMFATMYDYAKLGSVFLNGGMFQGERILPKEWIDYSLTPVSNSNSPGGGKYGAGWWLDGYPTVPYKSYNAFGAFGQRVFIVPEKDLMILHFGLATGAYQDGYVWNTEVGTYLFGNITQAIG